MTRLSFVVFAALVAAAFATTATTEDYKLTITASTATSWACDAIEAGKTPITTSLTAKLGGASDAKVECVAATQTVGTQITVVQKGATTKASDAKTTLGTMSVGGLSVSSAAPTDLNPALNNYKLKVTLDTDACTSYKEADFKTFINTQIEGTADWITPAAAGCVPGTGGAKATIDYTVLGAKQTRQQVSAMTGKDIATGVKASFAATDEPNLGENYNLKVAVGPTTKETQIPCTAIDAVKKTITDSVKAELAAAAVTYTNCDASAAPTSVNLQVIGGSTNAKGIKRTDIAASNFATKGTVGAVAIADVKTAGLEGAAVENYSLTVVASGDGITCKSVTETNKDAIVTYLKGASGLSATTVELATTPACKEAGTGAAATAEVAYTVTGGKTTAKSVNGQLQGKSVTPAVTPATTFKSAAATTITPPSPPSPPAPLAPAATTTENYTLKTVLATGTECAVFTQAKKDTAIGELKTALGATAVAYVSCTAGSATVGPTVEWTVTGASTVKTAGVAAFYQGGTKKIADITVASATATAIAATPTSTTKNDYVASFTTASTVTCANIESKKADIEKDLKTLLVAQAVELVKDSCTARRKFTAQATVKANVSGSTVPVASVATALQGATVGGYSITAASATAASPAPSAASALRFAQWIVAAIVVAVVATF